MLSDQEKTYLEHLKDFPHAYGLVLRSRIRAKAPDAIRELVLVIERDEPKKAPLNRTRSSSIGRWQRSMLDLVDVDSLVRALIKKYPTLVRQELESQGNKELPSAPTTTIQIGEFRGRRRPQKPRPETRLAPESLREVERLSPNVMIGAVFTRKVLEFELEPVEADRLVEDWKAWRAPRAVAPSISTAEQVIGELAAGIVSQRPKKSEGSGVPAQ